MNNLKDKKYTHIYNVVVKNKENFLYTTKSCNVLKSASGVCLSNSPITKFKVNSNSRYNIFTCKNKNKTQIRAYKANPQSKERKQINSNKRTIIVDKLTNEVFTYLYFKKCLNKHNILKTRLMTYYGAYSCDETSYIHMNQHGYGNGNVSISKMKISDEEFVKELLIQCLGVLYGCNDACHGNLTLENVHVYPKVFKLHNFSNGVVVTNPRSKSKLFVSSSAEYIDVKFRLNKQRVSIIEDPELSTTEDALKFVTMMFIRGLKVIDIYTLLVSIALHRRFSKFFLNLHENKKSLEYTLQSIWEPHQRAYINMRISENIGKNSILDCMKFLTTPLPNGEFIIMRRNLLKVVLEKLLA